jgi:hypothetical protein
MRLFYKPRIAEIIFNSFDMKTGNNNRRQKEKEWKKRLSLAQSAAK